MTPKPACGQYKMGSIARKEVNCPGRGGGRKPQIYTTGLGREKKNIASVSNCYRCNEFTEYLLRPTCNPFGYSEMRSWLSGLEPVGKLKEEKCAQRCRVLHGDARSWTQGSPSCPSFHQHAAWHILPTGHRKGVRCSVTLRQAGLRGSGAHDEGKFSW